MSPVIAVCVSTRPRPIPGRNPPRKAMSAGRWFRPGIINFWTTGLATLTPLDPAGHPLAP
jgi:hypothetical protein